MKSCLTVNQNYVGANPSGPEQIMFCRVTQRCWVFTRREQFVRELSRTCSSAKESRNERVCVFLRWLLIHQADNSYGYRDRWEIASHILKSSSPGASNTNEAKILEPGCWGQGLPASSPLPKKDKHPPAPLPLLSSCHLAWLSYRRFWITAHKHVTALKG